MERKRGSKTADIISLFEKHRAAIASLEAQYRLPTWCLDNHDKLLADAQRRLELMRNDQKSR